MTATGKVAPEFRAFLETEMQRREGGQALILCPWDLDPLQDSTLQLRDPCGLQDLPAGGRDFALAIAAGVLEALSLDEGGALLAELRDLKARQLLAAVPAVAASHHQSFWGLDRMLSHGLEARTILGEGDDALAVYGFHIDRYKRTPDWLNARNWANPENWNRYRW